MFDEMSKYTKEKERLRAKGYATIQTNYGNLNVELHGDRVSLILPNEYFIQAEGSSRRPKPCSTGSNWPSRGNTMMSSFTG